MISFRAKTMPGLRFLIALVVMWGAGAQAQFNGPAPTSTGAMNQPQPITVDTAVLKPSPRDYVLQQGDMITVHVFEQPDYIPSVVIGTDGKVNLPLVGVVSLDHKTITAAEEIIADRLRGAGIYRDPQVQIEVSAGPGASVTVIGEARGVFPVIGSRKLLDVLAQAGGLPESASHVLTISRPGVPDPIIVDLGTDPVQSLAANIPIFPGDTIIVARVGAVYLMGSFKVQGKISLPSNTPLTLMQAVALGGGTSVDAETSQLRLIRTVGNKRTVVRLDEKRIIYGRDPDPILQPNDILFMPNNVIKTVLANGQLASVLGLLSVTLSSLAYVRSY